MSKPYIFSHPTSALQAPPQTGTGELSYLCEVFHQRLAELFSKAELPQLSSLALQGVHIPEWHCKRVSVLSVGVQRLHDVTKNVACVSASVREACKLRAKRL